MELGVDGSDALLAPSVVLDAPHVFAIAHLTQSLIVVVDMVAYALTSVFDGDSDVAEDVVFLALGQIAAEAKVVILRSVLQAT